MNFTTIDFVKVGCMAQSMSDAAKVAYWTQAETRQHHIADILRQFDEMIPLVAQLRADQEAVQGS